MIRSFPELCKAGRKGKHRRPASTTPMQAVTWRSDTLGIPTQHRPGHPSPLEWPPRTLHGTTACMCHTPPTAAPGLHRTDSSISSRRSQHTPRTCDCSQAHVMPLRIDLCLDTFTSFPMKALAYVVRLNLSQKQRITSDATASARQVVKQRLVDSAQRRNEVLLDRWRSHGICMMGCAHSAVVIVQLDQVHSALRLTLCFATPTERTQL